jgi:sedoheptulokinase
LISLIKKVKETINMHLIGIDIGTSKIGGILFDFKGKKSETVLRENNSAINLAYEWEKIQNPDKILLIVKEILFLFLLKINDIEGIGITGQMHGIIYVDKLGNPLSHLSKWQDGRGNLPLRKNMSYAVFLQRETGYPVSTAYGLVSLFFNYMNIAVPKNGSGICTIMDYVAIKLTGEKRSVIDCTNAVASGFFGLKKMKFYYEALIDVSIDPAVLSELVRQGEATGAYKNIPIYPAVGDNQASLLGSVKKLRESVPVYVGTSGRVSIYTDNYVFTKSLDIRLFIEGVYLLVGASLCGGISFTVLKNFFDQTIKLFCPPKLFQADFYTFANSIDPSVLKYKDSLKVKTLFNGTRANTSKKESIKNLSLENFTPENLVAGSFTGICDELYDYFKCLPETSVKKTRFLVGSGDAIRKNTILLKVFEKRFGLNYLCLNIQRRVHSEQGAVQLLEAK